MSRFCTSCGVSVAETDYFCTKCGATTERHREEQKKSVYSTEWVRKCVLRLFTTVVLLLLLAMQSDRFGLHDDGDNVAVYVIGYCAIMIVGYFVMRACWVWAPVASKVKVAVFLCGLFVVVGGWYGLDYIGPLSSFGFGPT